MADLHIVRRAPYGDNPDVGARARRTYERILDAAVRAFERHGFADTSIDDIARLARLSRATVYQYFENMDEIVRAASNQLGTRVMATVDRLEPVDGTAEGAARLRAWVSDCLQVMIEGAPVFDAWFDPTAPAGELVGMSADFRRRLGRRLGAKLAAAERAAFDVFVAALALYAIVTHISAEVAHGRIVTPREELVDGLADIFHRGLFPPKA